MRDEPSDETRGTNAAVETSCRTIAGGWTMAALAALLAAFLLLSWERLQRSYWIDEIVTVEMAEKERLSDLLASTRAAMAAPPLCHLLMRATRFLGPQEWVGRLPSLLLALGTILVVHATGRRLGGARLGLWAAFFAATSPLLLRYGPEARPYAHFIFFTAALLYGVVRLAMGPMGLMRPMGCLAAARWGETVEVFLLLAGVALAGLYSHFYFAFVLAPLGAMIPFAAWGTKSVRGTHLTRARMFLAGGLFAVLVVVVAAGYYPFYKFYKPRLEHLAAGGSKSETPVQWSDLGPGYALRMASPALLGYETLADAEGAAVPARVGTALFALLVAYGALQLARTQGWLGIGLAASVLIASALCGVFLVGRNFFHHRYFVFQVPFYALFAAAGARSLVDGACRRLSSPLSKGLALAGGVFLLCGLVGLRVAAAERLFGPPTGFAFAGQVVKAKYRPGDRVMILGPRSAFDRNMFFSEHTEPRYPLRREPFFARVGYLPTDAGMLEWALSGPGRTWLLRAYYGPWPDAVLYAKPRFHLFAEARQCDVYVARPTLGEPSVLTMFHVKHFPVLLPQATEITMVALDRLPLVVAADAESGAEKRVTWRLDGSLLTLERDADGTLASAPVWIEPGTHVLSLADGPESLRDLRVYADEGETIAAISRPRKVVFGGTVEFLGYDLEPSERLAPGDTLTVTYYWRALRRLEENLKLVLRYDSLDPRNPRAWVRIFNDHAGCYGLHPTCDWEPGRLVVERYNIRIPDTHPEGLCAIHAAVGVSGAIGTFDRRHAFDYHKYMAWSKDGEDVYTAGALEISSDRGPVFRVADSVVAQRAARGAPRQLSPALALLASHVEAATRDGASTLRLALLWECREPLDRHYRYHLTFRSPAGEDLPALVRPPFYDLYPTYAWQAGETLLDEMTLPLKEPLPGKATVVLQLATGQYDARGRLEAGETLGAPIPLGPLVWSATP